MIRHALIVGRLAINCKGKFKNNECKSKSMKENDTKSKEFTKRNCEANEGKQMNCPPRHKIKRAGALTFDCVSR